MSRPDAGEVFLPREEYSPVLEDQGLRRVWVRLLIGVLLVAALAAVVYCVPALRSIVGNWSVGAIKEKLLSLGPWAWAFSALLMILQAVISPLPAFMITIANGYVFGAFWGGVLALASATLAAQICYEAARAMGRPALDRWMGATTLAWADRFFSRHGVWAVLVARLLPFVPFDPISFAAGLTSTPRLRFVGANLVGQVPATFIYSTLGSQLEDGSLPPGALLGLAGAALAVLALAAWQARRRAKSLFR